MWLFGISLATAQPPTGCDRSWNEERIIAAGTQRPTQLLHASNADLRALRSAEPQCFIWKFHHAASQAEREDAGLLVLATSYARATADPQAASPWWETWRVYAGILAQSEAPFTRADPSNPYAADLAYVYAHHLLQTGQYSGAIRAATAGIALRESWEGDQQSNVLALHRVAALAAEGLIQALQERQERDPSNPQWQQKILQNQATYRQHTMMLQNERCLSRAAAEWSTWAQVMTGPGLEGAAGYGASMTLPLDLRGELRVGPWIRVGASPSAPPEADGGLQLEVARAPTEFARPRYFSEGGALLVRAGLGTPQETDPFLSLTVGWTTRNDTTTVTHLDYGRYCPYDCAQWDARDAVYRANTRQRYTFGIGGFLRATHAIDGQETSIQIGLEATPWGLAAISRERYHDRRN